MRSTREVGRRTRFGCVWPFGSRSRKAFNQGFLPLLSVVNCAREEGLAAQTGSKEGVEREGWPETGEGTGWPSRCLRLRLARSRKKAADFNADVIIINAKTLDASKRVVEGVEKGEAGRATPVVD